MSDVLGIVLSVVVGLAAGVVFFGGLYLTTRALPTATRPGLLVAASFFARVAAVLLLAWPAALLAAQWGLIGYLVGITAARLLVVGQARGADKAEAARDAATARDVRGA